MSTAHRPRISDLLVERVFLGEATEEERARVLADPDAAERLRRLPMENARFLVAHPPEDVVPRIEARVRVDEARRRLSQRNGLIGGLVLAPLAAAALSLLVVTQGPGTGTGTGAGPGPEHTTAKGLSSRLRVYEQTRDGVRRVAAAQVMRAGDTLQLGIVAGSAKHAAVYSIDGRGQVTRHFPVDGAGTGLGNGETRVPEAYELDDAPSFERFLLVTSATELDLALVEAAVKGLAASGAVRTADLELPEELEQQSFLVRKEER